MKKSVRKPKSKSKVKEIPLGTIRIGKNLEVYVKTKISWKKKGKDSLKKEFPEAFVVIELFKASNNFDFLIDKKNPKFLKGQVSPEERCQGARRSAYAQRVREPLRGPKLKNAGARINILPDGRKLDGAYSLFAKNITIHDQKSNNHWDVIYKNPNGKFAYHYTLDKKKNSIRKKFNHVKEFEKIYPKLERNVLNALQDKKDHMALPMFTLLKTYMRVGNEIYFKLNKHKGLTTLKKKNIKINTKNNSVNFKFYGKDGVPQNIIKKFPEIYIYRLKENLEGIKQDSFVFRNKKGNPLKEKDFKNAFKKYSGIEFYPHIVRSYIATEETEEFLSENKNPSKKEVKEFLKSVAEELGHKKYSKKNKDWEDSYTVTLGHYIDPKDVEKIRKMV